MKYVWKPIDTVPKDRPVDLWGIARDPYTQRGDPVGWPHTPRRYAACIWTRPILPSLRSGRLMPWGDAPDWYWMADEAKQCRRIEATYWLPAMPLPPDPE